ncbi:MAG: response regulator [Proteobacteria bacterium]|nr:response regulator [Pseudomonadota bacterium]
MTGFNSTYLFTAEGFDVVTTASPQEGLELASASSFDVILCDWKMPGFDGMNVVEEINRRSPDSTIVMISGYPSVGRATEAMKRGAMDYISKPFTPDEIINVVNKAIKRKKTEEKKTMERLVRKINNFFDDD